MSSANLVFCASRLEGPGSNWRDEVRKDIQNRVGSSIWMDIDTCEVFFADKYREE
jgi:hypothetical protein